MNRSISFRPFDFAGVSFHLEILVALGATEAEQLRVVSDETNAVTRVNRGATEPTLLKTHIITWTRMRSCAVSLWARVEKRRRRVGTVGKSAAGPSLALHPVLFNGCSESRIHGLMWGKSH